MVVCRVKSYAEEFVPIIDEKGEVHHKYKKQGRVCHHILFKKLHYNMYEESLFEEKVFEKIYDAILDVGHALNTYSMKKSRYFII
jgi:hypothetical protein